MLHFDTLQMYAFNLRFYLNHVFGVYTFPHMESLFCWVHDYFGLNLGRATIVIYSHHLSKPTSLSPWTQTVFMIATE